jgi:hypothetical protein
VPWGAVMVLDFFFIRASKCSSSNVPSDDMERRCPEVCLRVRG